MMGVSEMLSKGWALVPIPQGQKGPVHKGWNMRPQCITNKEQLHVEYQPLLTP